MPSASLQRGELRWAEGEGRARTLLLLQPVDVTDEQLVPLDTPPRAELALGRMLGRGGGRGAERGAQRGGRQRVRVRREQPLGERAQLAHLMGGITR